MIEWLKSKLQWQFWGKLPLKAKKANSTCLGNEPFPCRNRPVFRKEVRELIKEVPKVITKTIDRVVEVPEIKYVDKFEEVCSTRSSIYRLRQYNVYLGSWIRIPCQVHPKGNGFSIDDSNFQFVFIQQQKDPKCINMKHPSKPASSREYIYESPTQPSGIHPQMYTPYGNATAFLDTYAPSPTAPGMVTILSH